jgi:hypothetical protein
MSGNQDGFTPGIADRPSYTRIAEVLAELASGQELLELPVRVVDGNDQPAAEARVTPWALRSSLGHGPWLKDDPGVGVEPEDVLTDEDGTAVVCYPRYRDVRERIRTRAVSLFVDHPDFAHVDTLHIDVPPKEDEPCSIKLTSGVSLEIRPLIDGAPADLDGIFASWSDTRSWRIGTAPEMSADGTLRIPPMSPGENSILLVKLDGDRATHFSQLIDLLCDAGERTRIDVQLRPAVRIEGVLVQLRPAVRIEGVLSENVPRPIRQGRVVVHTLAPAGADADRVDWSTWVPVQPDGSFTIDGWPADEPLQLIALCDGYIAANGRVPDVVENRREAEKDPRKRPQVFDPAVGERIEVAMTPLVGCVVSAVDQDGKPVCGVTVSSYPNVCLWNGGSYGYCHPLVRGERLLRIRDYFRAEDDSFRCPFKGITAADGKLTLELPVGVQGLGVKSDTHELPVSGGRRRVHVKLADGETTEAVLQLQPRGTEIIGEWDMLFDVVFRDSIRGCLPSAVVEQMDKFIKRYQTAISQRNPELLSEACLAAADVLVGLGNAQEAARWRQKAAEQAERAKDIKPTAAKNVTGDE